MKTKGKRSYVASETDIILNFMRKSFWLLLAQRFYQQVCENYKIIYKKQHCPETNVSE